MADVTPVAGQPVLSLRQVSKSFGAVQALTDISFDVHPSRVHGLVGENGAGKSTLVKIITGLAEADAGAVLIEGRPVRFHTPIEARASGVVAVYQDPKLFPHLSVAENILLGFYPTGRLGAINRRRMHDEAARLLAEVGSDIDPSALVASLSVAEHQFVEIARALSGNLRLLILDEPTSPLTPAEAERLFEVVRRLRARGAAILLITHRLEEIEAMSDDITVLRDGRHVRTAPAATLDREALVQLMVGRPLAARFKRSGRPPPGDEILRVQKLSRRGAFRDISFSVRAGEIVGLGGLVGAGRSEIAQAVFGVAPPDAGRVFLAGREVTPRSPRQMLGLGLAYLPEDRDRDGLIVEDSITHNITLPILRRFAPAGWIDRAGERRLAEQAADAYAVKTPTVEQAVAALSGGNRQKVAFAKWLATDPKAIILDEPTHGIDVGSKAQVHEMIASLAARGLAVVLISSDLPELLAVSDRILVIAEGRLAAEFAHNEATQEKVMAAAGEKAEAAE